jgi:hypothetical protein
MRWYDEVSAITSKQDGFIYKMNYEYSTNPIIYLYFESEEKLSTWVSTKIHDNLASKIEVYFLKPEEVAIEEIGSDSQR